MESFTEKIRTPGDVYRYASSYRCLAEIFLPLLYRHINIYHDLVAGRFLNEIRTRGFDVSLLRSTRTLQLHSDMPMDDIIKYGIKAMPNLKALNICFRHDDKSLLPRIRVLTADLKDTLDTIHLHPVKKEILLKASERLMMRVDSG